VASEATFCRRLGDSAVFIRASDVAMIGSREARSDIAWRDCQLKIHMSPFGTEKTNY
jgi:hypothetical protein